LRSKNERRTKSGTLFKGQAKFIHCEHRNIFKVAKKPAMKTTVSALDIGPGRCLHSFGEPWLAQHHTPRSEREER